MTQPVYFQLDAVTVVDVLGADADTIVHNLTTNEVKSLELGDGRETFVTDVKGKLVGHVMLYRLDHGLRMLGASGQSERIAAHVDRYTIREDAQAQIRDQEYAAFVVARSHADSLGCDAQGDPTSVLGHGLGDSVQVTSCRWLGDGTLIVMVPMSEVSAIKKLLESKGLRQQDEAGFHRERVQAGFPWFGMDLDETNLPQEADRDELTISFTKGCYLGQETVARLDAMGQVQKKLVRWIIRDAGEQVPSVGAVLASNEKSVGRLTSISEIGDGVIAAIGFARRSHFEAGSVAVGKLESSEVEFTAEVQSKAEN